MSSLPAAVGAKQHRWKYNTDVECDIGSALRKEELPSLKRKHGRDRLLPPRLASSSFLKQIRAAVRPTVAAIWRAAGQDV